MGLVRWVFDIFYSIIDFIETIAALNGMEDFEL